MGNVNGAGFGAIACTTTGENASVLVVGSSSQTQLGLGSARPEQTPQLANEAYPGTQFALMPLYFCHHSWGITEAGRRNHDRRRWAFEKATRSAVPTDSPEGQMFREMSLIWGIAFYMGSIC